MHRPHDTLCASIVISQSRFAMALVFQVLAVLCIKSYDLFVDGTVCYNCDRMPHQRDCDVVVECGSHEVCYGEKVVTPDGITYFRSGCKAKSFCTASTAGLILGKRNIIPCSQCCDTSYCNRELCDIHVQSNDSRCLSCVDALTPESCFVSVQCSRGEICFSQTFIHNHEKRYRLGCIQDQKCGLQSTTGDTSVQNDYCGQCCKGENCNRDVCSGLLSSHLPLLNPPPLMMCRDNSTTECQKNTHRCLEDYYKLYQCPYTCGFCTGQTIDVCNNSLCKNGGSCRNTQNSYVCECLGGYTGQNCETDVDECSSSPCKNGGSCRNQQNSYDCSCLAGYTGENCETDVDECRSSPCKNGGSCKNLQNSYVCECLGGYTGQNCETDVDECSNSPCKNGGSCRNQQNSYACDCLNGYTGHNCETDVNECSSSPCKNGESCKHLPISYVCSCQDGYIGKNCETACNGPRYFHWQNHCYYITEQPDVWINHKSTHYDPCHERNMRLADINSNAEHNAIFNYVRHILHESRTFWLGGKYNIDEDCWYWKDGRLIPANDHHWEGVAGSDHDHSYCMVMYRASWSNRLCTDPHIHLCKS